MSSSQILSNEQCHQKLNRMSHQLLEDFYAENEIVFAGIIGNGFEMAKMLQQKLEAISSIKVTLAEIKLDKKNPLNSPVQAGLTADEIKDKVIIVIDDVLNSGRTLIYALKPFLEVKVKKLATAVLVDRSYKDFPVHADYVGLSLATTLQDHVEVKISGNSVEAWLR